jgi:hypothetical protein
MSAAEGPAAPEQALLWPSADRVLADARFLDFTGAVTLLLKTPPSVPVA